MKKLILWLALCFPVLAGAAPFAQDDFTGITLHTNIIAYSAAANCAGAATSCWTLTTGQSASVLAGTGSNSIFADNAFQFGWQTYSWTFAQATNQDYDVSATITSGSSASNTLGICGRIASNASDAAANAYCVRWDGGATWRIQFRKSGTTSTAGGGGTAGTCSPANDYTGDDPSSGKAITLRMTGTATTIVSLIIGGTTRISCTDTSSPITGKGFAGVYDDHAETTTSRNLKLWSASDYVAPATGNSNFSLFMK